MRSRQSNRRFIAIGIVFIALIFGIIFFAMHDDRGNTLNSTMVPASSVGISFGDTLPYLSEQKLNAEFDDLVALKIGWVRFDMAWDDVQPNNSSDFNWTNLDRIVAAANARHLALLPDLAYTPAWARPGDCTATDKCEPANPALFADFVQAAVTRYAPQGISDWEIWNEPNTTGFWQPAPSAADYAALLKAAYTTIKAIQPSSTVITAGLAPATTANGKIAPLDFLAELYNDGVEPYFDAVGFHPYSYPEMPLNGDPANAWTQMADTSPSLRSIMTANGDAGKKIWMTEFGAPTGGPGSISEGSQAQMLSQAITAAAGYSWAGPLFIYSYQDLGTSQDTVENFFGILRFDGSEKPAYTTIKSLL